ncbi:hypothetical protein B7755_043975 [Streptomyces sp. NBS 14/10]|uniref:hypothetical protein n=1 Tax=Streptomyces sp. NBS 14/10 TaxID=1945643 RepID=UPI000B7D4990|nr:hypothetical protein [Streptomyces sp. NBS 14/10]KAK1184449.1 hypothetical protein B7755_043975 [Streptomyces sp. NBS 14/10]
MIWWFKARAVPALTASVLATNALGLLMGNTELPVPVLTGQSGTFLVGHLITLLPAVMLLHGMGRGDLRTESVACRPLRLWDAALGSAVAATGAGTATLCYALGADSIALILGRNIAGYVGLALLLFPFFGHRIAAVIVAVVPLLFAATGWTTGGRPEPWAWILYPADSVAAPFITAAIVLAGILVCLTRQRPLRFAV